MRMIKYIFLLCLCPILYGQSLEDKWILYGKDFGFVFEKPLDFKSIASNEIHKVQDGSFISTQYSMKDSVSLVAFTVFPFVDSQGKILYDADKILNNTILRDLTSSKSLLNIPLSDLKKSNADYGYICDLNLDGLYRNSYKLCKKISLIKVNQSIVKIYVFYNSEHYADVEKFIRTKLGMIKFIDK